jgi:exodeoxyribonuclease VII small subunit
MTDFEPMLPSGVSQYSQSRLPLDQPGAGWYYEGAVEEIEAIIAKIESGELGLADVFSQFSTAVGHLQQCEDFLQQRRQQMDLLIEQLDDATEF